MAKLFSKDYHEKSSTWYFNHVIIPLNREDLLYWKSVDEKDMIHLHFFPAMGRSELFCRHVDIVYDPLSQSIVSHNCAECKDDENCRHYLSILRYAYNYLTTDIFDTEIVETCFGNVLRADEAWLLKSEEREISIEGIFNPETDKIRFYMNAYAPVDIFQMMQPKQTKENHSSEDRHVAYGRDYSVYFSDSELILFQFLVEKRSAYSAKGKFFSIYKKDFASVINLMQIQGVAFVIRESGEKLEFIRHPLALSMRVEMYSPGHYLLSPVIIDELSVWFAGKPTWLFFRNVVRSIDLPFSNEVTDRIFGRQMSLTEKDLVYFRTIVHRELKKADIYLDFEDNIELPTIISDDPLIHLVFKKMDDVVVLEGYLKYSTRVDIPLSVIRFNSPLIKTQYVDSDGDKRYAWFYIPPQIFEQVKLLLRALPNADMHRLEEHSQLVFEGEDNIDRLKKAVYELSETNWEIEISEELRRDFIYRVPLQVEINARTSDEIDWFSYDVRYRYKDFSFSHEELKRYFESEQKFLQTADGRLVFISNREVFDETQRLLTKSEHFKDGLYRTRVQNLPYYMQLRQSNPAFRIFGDEYIDKMFTDLLSRKMDRTEALPQYLQAIMRSYQKSGYSWLKMLENYHLNGVLADEMGLGKTLQALSLIAETPANSVSLVICPKTLLYNWAAEIDKFHTNIPFCVIEGDRKTRKELINSPNIRLFIVSYSIATNDIDELRKIHFNWIILDEAQNIKNVSTLRSAAIKKLSAKHKMALSGTPIENRLTEIWSIYDFLMPGYLGSLNRFKKEFSSDNPDSQSRLHRAIAPFLLRRIKKEVLLELPDKQEQVSWCKLSPVQEKMYLQIIEQVKKQLFNPEHAEMNYIHVLSALTKLRQICNHPSLINPDVKAEIEVSTKLEQLLELVTEAIQNGHKILVFSQFVQMLKLIRKAFDEQGISYAYLDGKTKDRLAPVTRFNADAELKLFLISLKTGGVGLNLTAADTVILFDPWWNPMIENQAIDRTHRIGQSKKVQVIRLITKGTVEEKIAALQQSKLDMFKNVVEDGQQVLRVMSLDEIKALFHYQA